MYMYICMYNIKHTFVIKHSLFVYVVCERRSRIDLSERFVPASAWRNCPFILFSVSLLTLLFMIEFQCSLFLSGFLFFRKILLGDP